MSQQNNDLIQAAVEACADDIYTALGTEAPPFLAVHFICGVQERSGLIRKSAIRLSDEFLSRVSTMKPEASQNSEVLLNHVRLFDRKNTLLTLAIKRMRAHPGLWLRIGNPKPKSPPDGLLGDSLKWPERINEFLVTKDEATDYLRRVYSPGHTLLESEDMFSRKRAEAYGRWLAANKNEEKHDEERLSEANDVWESLHPLQSSLVYFAVACDDPKPTGELLVFPLKPLEDSGLTPLVVIVASGRTDHFPVERLKPLINNSALGAHGFADYLRGKDDNVDVSAKGIRKYKQVEKAVEACGEQIFPVPGLQKRFRLLFRWMAHLIEGLKQAKHEGHPLDFWFVAGDASEFQDDPDIRMTKRFQLPIDAATYSPPLMDADWARHLAKACKLLEKEHFPWFGGGQHALFFDLSHEAMLTTGLCAIQRSSWEFQLGEIYKSKQEQKVSPMFPACLIGFVSPRHGGAGIAVCDPEATSDKKLRMLARLGKDGWQTGHDKRETELKTVITGAYANGNRPNEDSIELFAQLCQLVADNPHAGGTFVLLNEDKRNEFIRMGDPWNFGELTLSEQIPLVSHDGATLIYLENGRPVYHHRYILTPQQLEAAILEKLTGTSKIHDSPLASVGTRRWSSAMASFRKGVEAVIVISQDGDITCYRSPGENSWNKTTVQKMPAGKAPEKPRTLNSFFKV